MSKSIFRRICDKIAEATSIKDSGLTVDEIVASIHALAVDRYGLAVVGDVGRYKKYGVLNRRTRRGQSAERGIDYLRSVIEDRFGSLRAFAIEYAADGIHETIFPKFFNGSRPTTVSPGFLDPMIEAACDYLDVDARLVLEEGDDRARMPHEIVEEVSGIDRLEDASDLPGSTKTVVNGVLSTLVGRKRKVIELRFLANAGEGLTLEEIARCLDLTRERVRQIELKTMKILRHPSRYDALEQLLRPSILDGKTEETSNGEPQKATPVGKPKKIAPIAVIPSVYGSIETPDEVERLARETLRNLLDDPISAAWLPKEFSPEPMMFSVGTFRVSQRRGVLLVEVPYSMGMGYAIPGDGAGGFAYTPSSRGAKMDARVGLTVQMAFKAKLIGRIALNVAQRKSAAVFNERHDSMLHDMLRAIGYFECGSFLHPRPAAPEKEEASISEKAIEVLHASLRAQQKAAQTLATA